MVVPDLPVCYPGAPGQRLDCEDAGMRWVGLTGGIGSGKSSVAARLAELGAIVIDSDKLAKAVVSAGTDGFAQVVTIFGDQVVGADGELDRAALGRLVFADSQARRRLEEIVHPRVRAAAVEIAQAAPPDAVVVNDVPLLVEAGLADQYELVIVVFADPDIRLARLARDRGMSEQEARSRMAAQATDEQRHAVADLEIVNDGDLAQLHAAVDRLWHTHLAPSAA
jgi:dephospho-CoA kinase